MHAACVSRGRRGERCDRWPRWASFCVAGAGNRARQLKLLDFVALCEKSAVRARVRALGVAKSWQAQEMRGFVDVSLERRCAVERSGRLWGLASGVSRVWRCAIGIAGGRVVCAALCHGDCWAARPLGGAVSWGLLTRVWSGWHRVIGIADQGVVWVAACHWDC